MTDAMLLGHWYLVQPGLPRRHLNELVRALGWCGRSRSSRCCCRPACSPCGPATSTTVGTAARLVLGRLRGDHDRAGVRHRAALRERYYSAVMAATGLLYLAILTAFGTDLVARAVLAG